MPRESAAGGRRPHVVGDGFGCHAVGVSEVVRAELVATVQQVMVAPGEHVAAGQPIAILESMKMEIPVLVETAGTVREVEVGPGDVIQEGDVIAVIGDG
jgi:biotin carboxyl carrier protein